MARIYRLDDSTLYLCNFCLDEFGPVPGKWQETPLETCSVCGDVDLQTQEEMDAYHHHMSNLQYEDYDQGQFDDDPNPYQGTHSED